MLGFEESVDLMRSPRLTLLASQDRQLVDFLDSHPDGHERAAIVLFRRIHRAVEKLPASDRYLAVEVLPFEDDWVTSSSPVGIQFQLEPLRECFRRCADENLVFGFVHCHPNGGPEFSSIDDANERTLLQAIRNRNGIDVHFVAMLWSESSWHARVRHAATIQKSVAARHVAILGEHVDLQAYCRRTFDDAAVEARQAAAFGQPLVDKLKSLRVGVVGAGGTGSPTITLLARAGVGEIVVFDCDPLEQSNLNRVRGAGSEDVGKSKSKILATFVDGLELSTEIVAVDALIDQSEVAVDALATCDIVFGCTDDQIGRELLNTAVYMYALAYVDVGLGGRVHDDRDGIPILRYHFARISTILPEAGECLFCQGVIRDAWIQAQYAIRANPNISEDELKERYLEGGGEAAPGVGPFTSAAADFGVQNLFELLREFRRSGPELRSDLYTIDFVNMDIRSKAFRENADCPYCQQKVFLLQPERYRLNRPALGKTNVAV